MYKNRVRIGLSLSGGGARGFAHVGALQALLEAGIEPDAVAGASAGSVVAALYAAGFTPPEMQQFIKESNFLRFVKLGIPSGGLSKLTYLRDRLEAVIQTDEISDLKHSLWVAITNLNTGSLELRNKGPLYDVVMASCSIPLVFQPVELDDQLYVDGGLLCNLPVAPLRDHSDFVIGVNLTPPVEVPKKTLSGVVGIAYRCFDLSVWANTQPQAMLCDFLLEPDEIVTYTIFQFNKYEKIYELGYQHMKARIPALIEQLNAYEQTPAKIS
ncbi:MAG: patatin-like phospholipase family protein [Bacteroidota bacterium]